MSSEVVVSSSTSTTALTTYTTNAIAELNSIKDEIVKLKNEGTGIHQAKLGLEDKENRIFYKIAYNIGRVKKGNLFQYAINTDTGKPFKNLLEWSEKEIGLKREVTYCYARVAEHFIGDTYHDRSKYAKEVDGKVIDFNITKLGECAKLLPNNSDSGIIKKTNKKTYENELEKAIANGDINPSMTVLQIHDKVNEIRGYKPNTNTTRRQTEIQKLRAKILELEGKVNQQEQDNPNSNDDVEFWKTNYKGLFNLLCDINKDKRQAKKLIEEFEKSYSIEFKEKIEG